MLRRLGYALLTGLALLLVAAGILARLAGSGSLLLWGDLAGDLNLFSPNQDIPISSADLDQWITAEKVDIAPCRNDDGSPSTSYWAVVRIRNSQGHFWMTEAAGELGFVENGEIAGGFNFSGFAIGPNSVRWYVDPNLLAKQTTILLDSPEVDSAYIKFRFSDFYKPIESPNQMAIDARLLNHSATPGTYPRHSLKIQVDNRGSESIYQVKVFGIVYNSQGQLVDLTWSEKPVSWSTGETLKPNDQLDFELESVARTGRCRGAADPQGYQIEYWVDGLTFYGMPVFFSYPLVIVSE